MLHLHAKYAVFDCSSVVVLSENFVSSAFPSDQLRGNRGWCVAVSDVSLAQHMTAVYDSDARLTRSDVKEWRLDRRYDPSASLETQAPPADAARIIETMTTTLPSRTVTSRLQASGQSSGQTVATE